MSIFLLPDELLVAISRYLEDEGDVFAMAIASRHFFPVVIRLLYRHKKKHGDKTILRLAARDGTEMTMERGVVFNSKVLDLAVKGNHTGFVKMILTADAKALPVIRGNPGTSSFGESPLEKAVLLGLNSMLRLFLDHEEWAATLKNGSGYWILSLASKQGNSEAVSLLLDHGADPWDPSRPRSDEPLLVACHRGDASIADLLLKRKPEMLLDNKLSRRLLSNAAVWGHTELCEVLLDHGMNLEGNPRHGETPLWCAVHYNELEAAKLLIHRGANTRSIDKKGYTLMQLAVRLRYFKVFKLLIENDADVIWNERRLEQKPLGVKSVWGRFDLVEFLLQHGGLTGPGQQFALHEAAKLEKYELVKMLLDNGVDVDSLNEHNQTPLHIATAVHNFLLVTTLLRSGADMNRQDDKGRTALFYAAVHGYSDIVTTLLSHGVEMGSENLCGNEADVFGTTPIFAATRNGHLAASCLLLSAQGTRIDKPDGFGRSLMWWVQTWWDEMGAPIRLAQALADHAARRGIQLDDGKAKPEYQRVNYQRGDEFCDLCTRLEGWRTTKCDECDVSICEQCWEMGGRCLDASHSLEFGTLGADSG